jgi:hypothetical protein
VSCRFPFFSFADLGPYVLHHRSELDVMGCAFVMPSVNMYNNNSFTSCEADVGEAPGLYPVSTAPSLCSLLRFIAHRQRSLALKLANGSTSTFRQRYTGSYTDQGTLAYWTIGQEVTPSGPATTPAVSQCTTYSTIASESSIPAASDTGELKFGWDS